MISPIQRAQNVAAASAALHDYSSRSWAALAGAGSSCPLCPRSEGLLPQLPPQVPQVARCQGHNAFLLPPVPLALPPNSKNAGAARVLGLRAFDHTTPALRQLHWLSVIYCVQYKLSICTQSLIMRHQSIYSVREYVFYFFADLKKRDFLRFFEMTYQKVVKVFSKSFVLSASQ